MIFLRESLDKRGLSLGSGRCADSSESPGRWTADSHESRAVTLQRGGVASRAGHSARRPWQEGLTVSPVSPGLSSSFFSPPLHPLKSGVEVSSAMSLELELELIPVIIQVSLLLITHPK